MALRDELLNDFLNSPLASIPEIKAEFIADLDFLSGETWPTALRPESDAEPST